MIDLRRGGGYAEYAIVRAGEAAPKPARATHVEAAGVPLVALTAWQALFEQAKLERGQTILIHAGAGGVGSVAVQLAKWKGARVIATASAANHEFLRGLGADEVIDYRTQRFEDVAKDVDVVLDPVGGDTQDRSFGVLRKGGALVSIVGRPSEEKAKAAGVRAASMLVRPDAGQLAEIGKLIDAGAIKPVVTHVLPLAEAAKAHEQSETGHTRGKIVLEVVPAR
jgi:NADPH:quinone reductase-like Zn-dependent oxidoreductase